MKVYSVLPHRKFWFAAIVSSATAIGGLLGGMGLQATEDRLVQLTPLLIGLPAMYAICDNYAMLIAAHLGDPQADSAHRRALIKALVLSVPVCIIAISVVSLLVSALAGYHLNSGLIQHYIIFYAVALTSIVAIIMAATLSTNKLLARRAINSDDILVSVMDNFASLLVPFAIALAAVFYL